MVVLPRASAFENIDVLALANLIQIFQLLFEIVVGFAVVAHRYRIALFAPLVVLVWIRSFPANARGSIIATRRGTHKKFKLLIITINI